MSGFVYKQGSLQPTAHVTWYRGEHCNYVATKAALVEAGDDAVRKYILDGWLPPQPFITRNTLVSVFGSCFAHYITEGLRTRGYRVPDTITDSLSHVVRYGAGINNTFTLRQQFEWAFRNKPLPANIYDAKGLAVDISDAAKAATRATFDKTDVFILTIGLAEIWWDKLTNQACWRAVPLEAFDPARHEFRLSTVEENEENLCYALDLLTQYRPEAFVILTLSPVRLVATFRPVSCSTANAVSKAVLRTAIDKVMERRRFPRVFYWPSYEIAIDFWPVKTGLSPYQEDGRHPKMAIIELVVDEFVKWYCVP